MKTFNKVVSFILLFTFVSFQNAPLIAYAIDEQIEAPTEEVLISPEEITQTENIQNEQNISNRNEKINICHKTGDSWMFMDTPAGPSLDGHLGHGDFLYDSEWGEGSDQICINHVPQESPQEAQISAAKIICDNEADLPNWGSGGPDITAATAPDFLATHPNCHEQAGWKYQWAIDPTSNPGDNVESAGGAWETFDENNLPEVPVGSRVWVREEIPSGYLPFSSATSDLDSVTAKNSAEFYCSTDVLNYDNYEWIDITEPGIEYHCIAFNVPTSTEHKNDGFIHIFKFVNGVQATAENANGATFPMFNNRDVNTFTLSPIGWWGGNDPESADIPYEATAWQAGGGVYSAWENLSTDVVGESCDAENSPDYELVGYSSGATLEEAKNAPVSKDTPSFTIDGDVYMIVWNHKCGDDQPQTSVVTMCKTNDAEQPQGLSGWTLMLKGDHVQDLSVNSNSSLGINTANTLIAGASYIAQTVGTWLNQGGANPVDTEYSTTDGWATHMDGYTGYQTDILELQIDSKFDPNSNWGSYNSLHKYAQSFVPTGTSSNFRIFDGTGTTQNEGWFGDNSGSLGVSISKGFSGITGENGCVTFTNVPYGTYSADEIMKDGWINVSGLGELVVDAPTETRTIVNHYGEIPPPICDANLELIANGSLETGVANGTFATLNAGDNTSITNWTVDSGSVDYIGSYWQSSKGARNIDLNGLTTGSISQTIPTIVGKTYTVTFDLSGNPDSSQQENLSSPSLKTVRVSATGTASTDYTFDTAAKGNTKEDMKWIQKSYVFVATATSTTITFASQTPGAFGPAVDNITVKCAPDTDTAKITIIKHTVNGNGTFNFSVTGQEGFGLTTVEGEASTVLEVPATENIGYDITEAVVEGWDLTNVTCLYSENSVGSEIQNGKHIVLDDGDEVTCTFTNTKKVEVDDSNQPPVADAGPDQSINTSGVILDGSASTDADGAITDYTWTYVSGPTVVDPADSEISGAGSLVNGVYVFQLVVTDNDSAVSTPDTVTITVNIEESGGDDCPAGQHSNGDGGCIPNPQCSDNLDNDQDGLKDILDPGCHTDGDANNAGSYVPSDNDESNGGNTITTSGRRSSGSAGGYTPPKPVGEVLGASTQCGIYIDKFLRRGYNNNTDAVKKLQQFLNDYMKAGLVVDGKFGLQTEIWLKKFQSAYPTTVLSPWGFKKPTGIFYLTTQTQVNNIMCPDLKLPIPKLTPIETNPLAPKKI